MKYFIVTVDTEGDNLWAWKQGQNITTENSSFVPRFQELCEAYGFKPVYLTNYEMALDQRFVNYIKGKNDNDLCEIGLHLHAWNNPPFYDVPCVFGGNPYITEYPEEIIDQKINSLIDLLQNTFEIDVVSHRAGRWALNDKYLQLLHKHGIKVDCSVTPQLDLSKLPGSSVGYGFNYSRCPRHSYTIIPGVLEIPMTTRVIHHVGTGSIKHKLKNMVIGDSCWLRPITHSFDDMRKIVDRVDREKDCDHLEFMIHSSELMPGGSPYFRGSNDIDILYENMNALFQYVSDKNYVGVTTKEYWRVSDKVK